MYIFGFVGFCVAEVQTEKLGRRVEWLNKQNEWENEYNTIKDGDGIITPADFILYGDIDLYVFSVDQQTVDPHLYHRDVDLSIYNATGTIQMSSTEHVLIQ